MAGLDWRIKLYPRGNETEYLAVYLECESLLPDLKLPYAFEDGGDRMYFNEPLPALLPVLDGKELKRRRRYPVQLGVLMYNPAEKGALSVLTAAAKEKSVKRVVVTSSVAAVEAKDGSDRVGRE